jgi:hypothetical protein
VWSLGVSVFMMLVGRSPFHAANRKDLIETVRRSEPSFPDDLDLEWRKLLKGMLSKDAATRSSLSAVMRNKMFADYIPTDQKPNPMRGTIVVTEDDLCGAIAEREDVELIIHPEDLRGFSGSVRGSSELRVGGYGSGGSLVGVRSAGEFASPAGSGGSRSMMSLPQVAVDSPSNILRSTGQNNTTTSSGGSSTSPTGGNTYVPGRTVSPTIAGLMSTQVSTLLSPSISASNNDRRPHRNFSIELSSTSVAFEKEASSIVVGGPSLADMFSSSIRTSHTHVASEGSALIPFQETRKGSSGSSTEMLPDNTVAPRVASLVVLSEEKIARALASRRQRHL